jgi:hypothetical protein
VKAAVDTWLSAAGVITGPIFRVIINKAQRIGENGFSPKVIWGVVKAECSQCDLDNVAPHDPRRTVPVCAMKSGGELEQTQAPECRERQHRPRTRRIVNAVTATLADLWGLI